MADLSQRKETVLSIIVDSYVESARPVASGFVANQIKVTISPATIRNEMGELESLGYITHPYTSAGRIPTDKGYRYYVDRLLSREEIPPEAAALIMKEFEREMENLEDLMERASRILSGITRQASLVSYPELKDFYFQHVDLIRLDRQRIGAVWFTSNGWAQSNVNEMGEDISPEALQRIENLLNQEFAGLHFGELKTYLARRLSEQQDSLYRLYEVACELVEEGMKRVEAHRGVRVEGSSYMLEKPEFRDLEKTLQIFHALEEKASLWNLLGGAQNQRGITVTIGRENKFEEMQDCALVTTGYGWQGMKVGQLGVLGPKRMRYSLMVELVDHVARQMTRCLEQW